MWMSHVQDVLQSETPKDQEGPSLYSGPQEQVSKEDHHSEQDHRCQVVCVEGGMVGIVMENGSFVHSNEVVLSQRNVLYSELRLIWTPEMRPPRY